MIKINGVELADNIFNNLRALNKVRVDQMLAIVIVGDDPASVTFVNRKLVTARDILAVPVMMIALPRMTSEEEVLEVVRQLGEDEKVAGIVLQLPLPQHINASNIISVIPREKDVDNLRGDGIVLEPAVMVVKEILTSLKIDIENLTMCVIGNGPLIGKPIFNYFRGKAEQVHLIDRTADRSPITVSDIIILGVGKHGVLKSSEIKDGALVIDFGTSMNEVNKLVGDFILDEEKNGFYTPTPSGTGPVLIAKLFENFFRLLEK